MITSKKIADYINEFLDVDKFKDIALNGLVVQNTRGVSRIGVTVDISIESINEAVRNNCDAILVHHGFFWGSPLAITSSHYERVKMLIENDIALLAYHLPLDANMEVGNNGVMTKRLGLIDVLPFGGYKGQLIGYKGILEKPLTNSEVIHKLGFPEKDVLSLDFGKTANETVAIVSGGAAHNFYDAVEDKIDLFITGDRDHTVYHLAKEVSQNIIFAGHYNTEIFGVKALAEHIEKVFGIGWIFMDIPTGL